ncbi:hypothetical protein C5473_07955 [Leptospira interrogans serovar Weerasinghe]|nr:hypothetical protein C5473_07955 [Leptospira interrogans serovar Weerasinghe]
MNKLVQKIIHNLWKILNEIQLSTFLKSIYKTHTYYSSYILRQNGAPSGLENRGLDARFAFTTKQENRQKERNEKKSICRNGCPQRNDSNCIFNE